MGNGAAAATLVLPLAVCLAVLSGSAAIASSADLPPYTNHTVGGDAGWVYNEAKQAPATDYAGWATNQSFFLGDYLIFKTNGNSSVIQTYNATTYKNCSPDDDNGVLTTVFGGGSGSGSVIAVPLTREGDNYYFSGTFDDTQCRDGMRFQIKVGKGRGLPPELNQPPPPPYVPPGPPPGQQQAAPAEATTPSTQQESFHKDGAAGGPLTQLGFLGLVSATGLVLVVA